MTMRNHFNQEIQQIKASIAKMLDSVYETIKKSYCALIDREKALAFQLIEEDQKIDRSELEIDDMCAILIATEQPVARDLRFFLSAIQITNDIERIGDHAVHNAKNAIRMIEEHDGEIDDNYLQDMSEKVLQMFEDTISLFNDMDKEKALEVIAQDEHINKKYKEYFSDILEKMKVDPKRIDQSVSMMFTGRFLERTADHLKNICKEIYFIESAEHYKNIKKKI